MRAAPPHTARLAITGMTCAHCELFVERIAKTLPGITRVAVSHRSGIAEIESDRPLDVAALDAALAAEGYGARPLSEGEGSARAGLTGAAAALVVVAGLVIAARHFELLPKGITVSDQMTLGFIFLIGLVASVSSCMAVTGGLLVALAAKYNEVTAGQSAARRFVPHVYFNAGRLLSYTLLGGLIGAAGAALTLSPLVTGVLTIAVSAIMIVTGLQMLGVMPRLAKLAPIVPKSWAHRIHDLARSESRLGAFGLGAATFFLPCGFTFALQLYVLSQGGFTTGALTMLVFALGTLPALLSLSLLSSFATGRVQAIFLKLAGAAVVVLGIMNIQYGAVQAGGSGSLQAAQDPVSLPAGALQIVEMKIDGYNYIPNRFTVKAGKPVEWRIDAREAEGCGRVLIMRGAGIARLLSDEELNIITFTPKRPGEIAFNCSMGMMTPGSGFTVTN